MEYISKKLGFTLEEFKNIIDLPNREHGEFGTDKFHREMYSSFIKIIKPASYLYKMLK